MHASCIPYWVIPSGETLRLSSIKRKAACTNAGEDVAYHFADVNKMVSVGSGVEREIDDIYLTRYACYLTAQNGDARKSAMAFCSKLLCCSRQGVQNWWNNVCWIMSGSSTD